MSALTVFLPKVLQYAPGCAEPAAFDAIRSAAIEFCERTNLWRTTLTCEAAANPVAIVPYDATPDADKLTLPADAVLHSIALVLFEGRELRPATTDDLDEHYHDWRTATDTGAPQYVTQLVQDELRLYPFAAGEIRATVRLKPTQDADTLPDFLADRYRDTIQAGALAKILLLPGQPFTNPDLAVFFAAKFQTDLDRLFNAEARGQQRAPVRTRPQYF